MEGEGGARSNEAQSGGAENKTAKQRVNYASSVWIGMKAMNKENNVYAGEYWGKCGSYSFCASEDQPHFRVPTLGLAGNGYGLGARTCMCWTCGRACQAEKEDHDKDLSAAVKATKRPDMKVESRTRAARPAARGGPRRSAGAPLPSPPDARSRRATSHTQMQDGARGRSARTARSDTLASRATSVLFSPRASLAAPREPHRPRRPRPGRGARSRARESSDALASPRDAVLVPRLVAAGLVDPLAILLLHEASMPHEGLPSREGGVLPPVLHRSLVGSVVVVLAVLLRGLQRALGACARHVCHLPSAVFGVCLRSVPLAPPLSNINYILV